MHIYLIINSLHLISFLICFFVCVLFLLGFCFLPWPGFLSGWSVSQQTQG